MSRFCSAKAVIVLKYRTYVHLHFRQGKYRNIMFGKKIGTYLFVSIELKQLFRLLLPGLFLWVNSYNLNQQ